MKLKAFLSLALIAVILAGCTYPPNGTAVTLTYPDGMTPGEQAVDGESRGVNTTTVRELKVVNNATVGGTLTVTGGVTGANVLTTGNQTAAGIKTWSDAAIFSSTVTAAGAIRGLTPVLLKTANYVATAADTGAVINTTNAMTVTLPAVAVGINLCVYNGDGADIKIDPNGTNTVLTLTNGNGDRVTNTTVGDSVCLVGLNTTSWMALERVGTWSDGN